MQPTSTIPEGLDLIPTRNGSIVREVWRGWEIIPLALFACVWDAFLVFWYSMATKAESIPWIVVVFPLGHVAVGVGITYSVFALLVNRKDVVISPGSVQVIIGPLPWLGNKTVKNDEIRGVLVRERTSGKRGFSYQIMYVDRARKERCLVASVKRSEQAEFIAGMIRQILPPSVQTDGVP